MKKSIKIKEKEKAQENHVKRFVIISIVYIILLVLLCFLITLINF